MARRPSTPVFAGFVGMPGRARGRCALVGLSLVAMSGLSACDGTVDSSGNAPMSEAGRLESPATTTPLWTSDNAWYVGPSPHLEIGVVSGASEYQFFSVSAAAFQSDGDLVVVDAGSKTIRLYDSHGVFKSAWGDEGDGPGQFRNPGQVMLGPSDEISIWDAAAWRVTRYDAGGTFEGVHTFRVPALSRLVEPPLYPAAGTLLTTGELLVRLTEKAGAGKGKGDAKPRGDAAVQEGTFRLRSGVLRVSANLADATIAAELLGTEQVTIHAPWGPWVVAPPLARRTVVSTQPGSARFCVGDQEEALVRCFDPEGAETALEWVADAIPVGRRDPAIEVWRERMHADLGQKLSNDVIRGVLDLVPLPKQRPPFAGIVLDADGNLWVERGPAGREGTEYLVFDSGATLLGSVRLPRGRVLEIGNNYVLMVRMDDLEVQFVQSWDLVKPGDSTDG